ncbi:MAG TPA: SDR family oxidoreductase [Phenylobacterium sp.]|jgi:NAD(P)-dependent dehydrogenase (short-subunit alcohol dehydrogenase family)|uniref:SDR family oxidoreductase n=1 Tax=Phenylobacterium sp. TaxID=1871053 RepID=UPI002C7A1D47|nr:SDR family oxidoreductase [Phenylobacterium sp.]HXA38378.1 SDR family oxidoreductase [Phenylobacterium sp.]
MTLNKQRIVVLGGTSGIGFAVAKAASERGAEVVVGSSSPTRVTAAVATLGAGAEGRAVDLSDETATRGFFEAVGEFDHLVYTAGEPLQLLGLEADLAQVRRFFELRYWGALAAAKYGRKAIRDGGSMVFTSGTAGARPLGPGWAAASSICGAMEGLTRALAVDLKPLRVNCVSPGVVKTDLWAGMGEAERDAFYASEAARLPVGHAGEVEEIAQGYLYLIRQTYVTGQVLYVDGGGLLA